MEKDIKKKVNPLLIAVIALMVIIVSLLIVLIVKSNNPQYIVTDGDGNTVTYDYDLTGLAPLENDPWEIKENNSLNDANKSSGLNTTVKDLEGYTATYSSIKDKITQVVLTNAEGDVITCRKGYRENGESNYEWGNMYPDSYDTTVGNYKVFVMAEGETIYLVSWTDQINTWSAWTPNGFNMSLEEIMEIIK